ncbi:MAG: nucleotide exchange factor GrpE [Aestuariivirgaceae bacterium]
MIDADDGRARRTDDARVERDRTTSEADVADQVPAHDESAARIDSLMRALADADNARKRAERHAAEVRQYAIGEFARDLLPVADNLRRALAAAAETDTADTLLEGVRATGKLLDSVLERHGVARVEAQGVPFDPRRHEAVAVIDDATREPGEVVDVVEEGYMIGDRLLRPARVLVNNPDRKPASDIYGRGAGP